MNSPRVHPRLGVGRVAVAGEGDDGRAGVGGANPLAQRQPLDARQPAVEDVEAEPLAPRLLGGGVCIGRDGDLEVRIIKHGLEHKTGVLVVFDAEDAIGYHR